MNNNIKRLISSLQRQNRLLLFSLFLACVVICIILKCQIWLINNQNECQANNNDMMITQGPVEIEVRKTFKVNDIGIKEQVVVKSSYEIAQDEYFAKMLELECGDVDKEEWYLGYKQLICEYEEYLDFNEAVYDVFTDDEIYLIQRCVETEVYQCSFDAKVNVASVIFNRINDGRFGKTVKEVITNPGQFAWHRTKISDSTVLAVEYAFEIGDTTGGCIAFRSDRKPEKWGKWVYRFSDSAVHHFYSD